MVDYQAVVYKMWLATRKIQDPNHESKIDNDIFRKSTSRLRQGNNVFTVVVNPLHVFLSRKNSISLITKKQNIIPHKIMLCIDILVVNYGISNTIVLEIP